MRGFTLLEVLVAISMLAIVMTSIYGVFSAVGATKQRLDSDSADYHLARVVFDRLGRELQGTYFRPEDETTLLRGGTNENGEPYLALTTTAVTPMSMTGTGIARVEYRLAEDPERPADRILLRGERSRLLPAATGPAEREHRMARLAPGIAELEVRFFGSGRWQKAWDSRRDGLPEMVKVSLLVGGEGERQTPFTTTFQLPEGKTP